VTLIRLALPVRGPSSVPVRNALSLYGAQAFTYLVSLATLPYLARVLGPEVFGLVALSQSFALWLAVVVEYGFGLSATRVLARVRDDAGQIAAISSGVMGARALLLGATLAAALAAGALVPAFRSNPVYVWWAWVIAAAYGMSPAWYFQGVERMHIPAAFETAGRVVLLAGIFVLVQKPEDGWLALAVHGVAMGLAAGLGSYALIREVGIRLPRPAAVARALRMGLSMFGFRTAVGAYTMANAFVLGLLAPPVLVGYFSGAERIARAALGLTNPLTQALYPGTSRLAARDPSAAAGLARRSLVLIGGGGIVLGAGTALAAPHLVNLLLGPGYEPAVPVLRVLALLLPLVAGSAVMGLQWMVPMGMDRAFNAVVAAAGLVNVTLAVLLAPRFGSLGMAWAVVASEAGVTVAMAWLLHRSGRAFWSVRPAGRVP
jgi:PST family polysaccharide transporter